MESYTIEQDPIAVGLTRPATRFGVPLLPFYFSILACFIGGMFIQGLTGYTGLQVLISTLMVWIVIYGVMFWVTFNDARGLMVFWLNCTLFKSSPVSAQWGHTDTFAP